MVDIVSDPNVLVLASPHLPLPLTEVDVQVMESYWRMWSASPSASPPGSALRLPDEVKSADDGDQAEHNHQEGHDADPDDSVGRGVERDQVRGGASPLWLSWTSPDSGLIIPAPDAELDDALTAGIHELARVRGHVRVTAVLGGVNASEVKLRTHNLAFAWLRATQLRTLVITSGTVWV